MVRGWWLLLSLLLAPVLPESAYGPVVTCDLSANPSGFATALQACIDATPPYAVLELPPGRYLLEHQVVIRRPLMMRTRGVDGAHPVCRTSPQACATLVAAPEFTDDNGMLRLDGTREVTLAHLVLDGNRAARLTSRSADACRAGNNRPGFNAMASSCTRCRLLDLVSEHALCGTGFEWDGAVATITASTFRENGDASNRMLWADGLTAVYAPDSYIIDNLFADNSDVGLIVGHGPRWYIARNQVTQFRQHAFAGLMLHNFNNNDLSVRGDFRGAVIMANRIECGLPGCGFGIELGPHPWDLTRNIVGGEVTGNVVSGAGIGINIDGAGTHDEPIYVYANTVRIVKESTTFQLCGGVFESSRMNIAPDSYVNRRLDKNIQTTRLHICQ